MKNRILLITSLLPVCSLLAAAPSDAALVNWPSFRGPLSTGVAPLAQPPLTWDETNNVRWKVAVPGDGNASPVVWGDQVFILTAIPTGKKVEPKPASETTKESPPPPTAPAASAVAGGGSGHSGGGGGGRIQVDQPDEEQRFTVISYDRATGKIRWRQEARTELPHEGHHKDHGYASASPVTDGEVLIAYFGSRGLYAYDLKGTPLWKKDLGHLTTRNSFGEGSSPALHGNTVVVVWDHEGEDFIAAFDKRTGKELWRKPREESTNWTTPLVVDYEGNSQVVVNSGNKVRSYNLADGSTIWEAGGQTQNAVPTPVPGHGRVYVTSGWRGGALQAITLGRTGDLTGTDAIAWSHNKNTPYVPSPLLYGDELYFFSNNNAQISIFNAREGKQLVDAERLDGLFGIYASPTAAAGRVYVTGRNGAVWVLKNGPTLEILAKNKLDDGFDATPALAGRELFLRGKKNLYALADTNASQQ
ncbi:MAG TPA: PQQ-like beta-propeller repeat protein [Verrucomicrobiota bacterium]|nr:PQQ-like beta-propeller repeat protein [Verrucomicrobiota bacterium]